MTRAGRHRAHDGFRFTVELEDVPITGPFLTQIEAEEARNRYMAQNYPLTDAPRVVVIND